MAEHVYQTLKAIIQKYGGMNESQVQSYMLSLRVSFFCLLFEHDHQKTSHGFEVSFLYIDQFKLTVLPTVCMFLSRFVSIYDVTHIAKAI